MEKINRSALVMFSAKEMYQLVDDINDYPQFVPNCKTAKELTRNEKEVTATLEVSKSGIAKSFTTKNSLEKNEKIKMTLINGPFKHLLGEWRFTPLSEEACKIEFDLEFEFSNKLASIAFAGIFNQLVESMIDAFTQRAEQIYGK